MGMFRFGASLAVVAVVPRLALAQAADTPAAPSPGPEPSAPQAQAAPDVVKLKDGGLFRGTISERVQGEYVEIVLVSGKIRRFTMAGVEFAGAASELPKTAAKPAESGATPPKAKAESGGHDDRTRPMVTINAPEARLSLTSQEPGITFHRRTGMAVAGRVSATGYDELCTAPCNVTIPAGTYTLALSRHEGSTIEAEPVTVPAGASRIHGNLESRSGLRTGLLLGGIGLIAVGGYLYVTASEEKEVCSELTGCATEMETDMTKLLLGITAASVGFGAALFSFTLQDKPRLEVRASPAAALRAIRPEARPGNALALAGRF